MRILAFLILIFWGVALLRNKQSLTSYSNFEPEWSFFSSCRIMVNGKLTPVDIVRELK